MRQMRLAKTSFVAPSFATHTARSTALCASGVGVGQRREPEFGPYGFWSDVKQWQLARLSDFRSEARLAACFASRPHRKCLCISGRSPNGRAGPIASGSMSSRKKSGSPAQQSFVDHTVGGDASDDIEQLEDIRRSLAPLREEDPLPSRTRARVSHPDHVYTAVVWCGKEFNVRKEAMRTARECEERTRLAARIANIFREFPKCLFVFVRPPTSPPRTSRTRCESYAT